MAEPARVSALDGHLAARRLGSAGPTGLRLSERPVGALWQVAAWPERIATVAATVAAAAGVAEAPGPGRSVAGAAARAIRTEPLKWWLLGEAGLPAPEIAIADGTVLDLSHARTRIALEGPAAPDLLARLVAIDVRPGRFEDGQVAATGLHGVGLLIARTGPAWEIFVPRSYALDTLERLTETGAQFGLETG